MTTPAILDWKTSFQLLFYNFEWTKWIYQINSFHCLSVRCTQIMCCVQISIKNIKRKAWNKSVLDASLDKNLNE